MRRCLIAQRGPNIGRLYELSAAECTIGSGPDNHVWLDDPLAGRYHAVIR